MTNRAAAQLHRDLDERQADAMRRDVGEDGAGRGAPMLPRQRRADVRSMAANGGKVLLVSLSERVSGKGNRYLAGWLGKAQVLGFRGEDDEHGRPTWDLFVRTPGPKPGTGTGTGTGGGNGRA